jgi:hypothetical protein
MVHRHSFFLQEGKSSLPLRVSELGKGMGKGTGTSGKGKDPSV